MANIRGNSFVAINKWLSEELEREDYEEVVSKLRPPVARSLREAEVWSWYPIEHLTEIYELLSKGVGKYNGDLFGRLGCFLAELDLGGAPRTRLAQLPVPRALARLPYLWSKCRDCGDFKLLSVDEKSKLAILVLSYYEGGRLHCPVTRTWIEHVTNLMSGNQVSVKEKSCRWKEGGDGCYWEVTWE